MHLKHTLLAWLATARAANLPTVWSQVFSTWFVTTCFIILGEEERGNLSRLVSPSENLGGHLFAHSPLFLLIACLGASAIYCGGCIFGDYFDRFRDLETQPNRPLPSGTISPLAARLSASALTLGGFLIISFGPPLLKISPAEWSSLLSPTNLIPALLLVSTVIAYAFFHKSVPKTAIPLMALCRALLIITIWLAWESHSAVPSTLGPMPLPYAAAVAFFTAGISIVARTETSKNRFEGHIRLVLFMALAPVVLLTVKSHLNGIQFASTSIFITWLTWAAIDLAKNKKGHFVSKSLAGFCLIDLLAVSGAAIAIPLSISTASVLEHFRTDSPLLLVPLACFALALLFQRFTPAT